MAGDHDSKACPEHIYTLWPLADDWIAHYKICTQQGCLTSCPAALLVVGNIERVSLKDNAIGRRAGRHCWNLRLQRCLLLTIPAGHTCTCASLL